MRHLRWPDGRRNFWLVPSLTMRFYVHLHHVDGFSELIGPVETKERAIEKAKAVLYNRDDSKWGGAVSECGPDGDPEETDFLLWFQDFTD